MKREYDVGVRMERERIVALIRYRANLASPRMKDMLDALAKDIENGAPK